MTQVKAARRRESYPCAIMGAIDPKVTSLFPTPVVALEIENAASLSADLRAVIEERERTHPGTVHSNMGGYQSSWDMEQWGGAPAQRLLGIAKGLADRMTTTADTDVTRGLNRNSAPQPWICNMWANINRSGDANDFHSHPGSFWSAVYYVDDGGIPNDPTLGGELEFSDPRGALPMMNAPHLRMAGSLSAGATERVVPKAGKLVMFPSWLMHQVRPYKGSAVRISIAMNLAQ